MFRALSSRVAAPEDADDSQSETGAPQPSSAKSKKAAHPTLLGSQEVGPGEDLDAQMTQLYGVWDERDGVPVPAAQPLTPSSWWPPPWAAPYLAWSPYNATAGVGYWSGAPRPAGSQVKPGGFEGYQQVPNSGWGSSGFTASGDEVNPQFAPLYSDDPDEAPRRPYGDVSLPLGGHLALSVKEKIWRGEYIDMFSLLHTEPEPVPKVGEPVRDTELTRRRKIDRNWTNWLYGYTIYMAVVTQIYPKKAGALIKYLDIIHRTLRDFGGQAWLHYDENFRRRAAHDPSLSWKAPQLELWVQIVLPSKPVAGDRSDSGHLIARNAGPNHSAPSGAQGVQRPRACFQFNSTGKCTKSGCNFSHICPICGGKHSARFCEKGGWSKGKFTQGGKRGDGGQPPASSGKGPVSN